MVQFAAIAILRMDICPAAVAFDVGEIYVLAFQRQPLWALTHVQQEGYKTLLPTRAYRDPTSTIVVVPLVMAVQAPLLHRHPTQVCG